MKGKKDEKCQYREKRIKERRSKKTERLNEIGGGTKT